MEFPSHFNVLPPNILPRQLTVVQQFKIDWGEPFASILVALEVRG